MSTPQECVVLETKRLFSLWKLRAVLFGTDFVVLIEKGKGARVQEAFMYQGLLVCHYGGGNWGPVRLHMSGETSDANYEWMPLTKDMADQFHYGSVMA